MASTLSLLPCPCGKEPSLLKIGKKDFTVRCVNEKCPVQPELFELNGTHSVAAKRWNEWIGGKAGKRKIGMAKPDP